MKTVVVVPCFNEEARFPQEYWENITSSTSFEWIFIDDGSTDATKNVLSKLKSTNVSIVSLERNQGKSEAIRLGMIWALEEFESDVRVIGYIDADGAFALTDILNLESTARTSQNYQMVWSSRVALSGNDIQRSLRRHYLGRIVSTIIWFGRKSAIYDTQSGLKFMPVPPTFEKILKDKFQTKWFVDLEFYSRWLEIVEIRPAVLEIPLSYWHEMPGSKVRISQALSIFAEILYVKKLLRRTGHHGS